MLCVEPQSAQDVQEQNQPTNQHASPNPTVERLQTEPDQRADKKENQQTVKSGLIQKCFGFVREYDAEIVAISTLVMAVFTVGLFLSNYLLWKSGERHSERELRAYVHVTEAGIRNFGSSMPIEANLSVKNFGQTPAYDFCLITGLGIYALPKHDFTPYERTDGLESKGTLGPGDSVEAPRVMPKVLTPEIHERILRREIAIFFFGKVDYRDAFGKRRFTSFRFIAEPVNSRTLSFTATDSGNDAT